MNLMSPVKPFTLKYTPLYILYSITVSYMAMDISGIILSVIMILSHSWFFYLYHYHYHYLDHYLGE